MAIDVMGNMIRMPVGDTGTIKFVAEEGSLSAEEALDIILGGEGA